MKKYEVTEETLKQAHSEACDKWKRIIEGIAPELFKPKFNIGDWVKGHFKCDEKSRYIGKITNIDCSYIHWNPHNNTSCGSSKICNCDLATTSEIEQHLIAIAKKKGFKEGVKCINVDGTKCTIGIGGNTYYNENYDRLTYKDIWVYKQGKWATIIEETKEVTMDEVRKAFGVTNIKIVG